MASRPTDCAAEALPVDAPPAAASRSPLSFAVRALVSIGIVGVLLLRIPPRQLLEAATSAGFLGYLGVTVGLAVFLLLGALRVQLTVSAFARMPFASVAWLYGRSVALGAFTPGQVGELSLALFLARRGIDTAQSLAITAVDRVTTLATLVGLTAIGLLLYAPERSRAWTGLLAGIGIVALSSLYVRPWRKRIRAAVEGLVPVAVPFFEAFCRFFLRHPIRAVLNVLLGLGRWACAALMLLVLIEPQLSTPVDRGFVLVANAAARLVTYVPISINGIGILELSAVELFALGGIPAQLTFAAFVVNRVVYYVFATALVVHLTWTGNAPWRRGVDA
jgi:uncharacterized protein (TIRG00374 family)